VATLGPNRQLFLVSCLRSRYFCASRFTLRYGVPYIADKVDLLSCVMALSSFVFGSYPKKIDIDLNKLYCKHEELY